MFDPNTDIRIETQLLCDGGCNHAAATSPSLTPQVPNTKEALRTVPWLMYTVQCTVRVADVEGPRDRRSLKGQGLLGKEGPTTYAILLRNFSCKVFRLFLKGCHPVQAQNYKL